MAPMSYCPECGASLERRVVAGEVRKHWFCRACRAPRHDHPLLVVTCFVACGQQLLWVQRELEPKRGLWAIPGGFLESGETLAEGAARELGEEAGIWLPPQQLELYMTGSITVIDQPLRFRDFVDNSKVCKLYNFEERHWVSYDEALAGAESRVEQKAG